MSRPPRPQLPLASMLSPKPREPSSTSASLLNTASRDGYLHCVSNTSTNREEYNGFSLSDFMDRQPQMDWASEPSSRRNSVGHTVPSAPRDVNSVHELPFHDENSRESVGRTTTLASPTNHNFSEGNTSSSSNVTNDINHSNSDTMAKCLSHVEAFHRSCDAVERDIAADEAYFGDTQQVEGKLRRLLLLARSLSEDITGSSSISNHNDIDNPGRGLLRDATGTHTSSCGGRKMEADLRLLGDVLKQLEIAERVLAPLERTHVELLKKYILLDSRNSHNTTSNTNSALCPSISDEAFDTFAAAVRQLARTDATAARGVGMPEPGARAEGGNRMPRIAPDGPALHVIDEILNGGLDTNNPTTASGGEEEEAEITSARNKLRTFHQRREAVKKALLTELLFKNKNEGGGGGGGNSVSQIHAEEENRKDASVPSLALEKEERCVLSGRVSDVHTILLRHSGGKSDTIKSSGTNNSSSNFVSMEEEPILIVNIENLAARGSDGDHANRCSPAYMSQLQEFATFQRSSYRLPGAEHVDANGNHQHQQRPSPFESGRRSFFAVITSPARFFAFHVLQSAGDMLQHLQQRVRGLLHQRQHLQLAVLAEQLRSLDPYDPQYERLEREKQRKEREVSVFSSWQGMMEKLDLHVLRPMQERMGTCILQQAMVRRGILEVLAQRIEDSRAAAAPSHPPATIEAINRSRFRADTPSSLHGTTAGGRGEPEDRFSHRESRGETAPVPPRLNKHHYDKDTIDKENASERNNSHHGEEDAQQEQQLPRASVAFLAMLQDIAQEQQQMLLHHHHHNERNIHSRKRGREGEAGEGEATEERAPAPVASVTAPLDPFVEFDVSTATPSRASSEGKGGTQPPHPVTEDGDNKNASDTVEQRWEDDAAMREGAVVADNGISTFFNTNEEVPHDPGVSVAAAATTPIDAVAGEGPVHEPLVVPPRSDRDEEKGGDGGGVDEDGESSDGDGPSPQASPNGRGKRSAKKVKRVYGLRTLHGHHDEGGDDASSASSLSEESGGGGGLWKGIGAFVRAVVRRATTFSGSDSEDDEDGPTTHTRKKRKL